MKKYFLLILLLSNYSLLAFSSDNVFLKYGMPIGKIVVGSTAVAYAGAKIHETWWWFFENNQEHAYYNMKLRYNLLLRHGTQIGIAASIGAPFVINGIAGIYKLTK